MALNRARQSKRMDSTEDITSELPSPEPTPEEKILQQERQTAVNQALNRLSFKERTLFSSKDGVERIDETAKNQAESRLKS
jgi:DNA-directed RNA polymerase specialized sigma24 family protein